MMDSMLLYDKIKMQMEKKDHVDTHSGILFVIDHGGILATQLYPECGCIVMAGKTNRFASMPKQINTFAVKAGKLIRFAAMGRVYNTVCLCLYFLCLKRK
nr:hypothetical protein [Tanacetum cinerariifolium]